MLPLTAKCLPNHTSRSMCITLIELWHYIVINNYHKLTLTGIWIQNIKPDASWAITIGDPKLIKPRLVLVSTEDDLVQVANTAVVRLGGREGHVYRVTEDFLVKRDVVGHQGVVVAVVDVDGPLGQTAHLTGGAYVIPYVVLVFDGNQWQHWNQNIIFFDNCTVLFQSLT